MKRCFYLLIAVADGRATAATLHRNSRDQKAKRSKMPSHAE
jgi:hypothetical protein